MKKKIRFTTIGNRIKEKYRELNNHIFKTYELEVEMRQDFKELIEMISKRFPRTTFLGDFHDIQEFKEEYGCELSHQELLETCFDDHQISFTLVGNLSENQESLLLKRLQVFQIKNYSDNDMRYYRFIFNFKDYFHTYCGEEWIEPYQVRKDY